jgi:hypothetical protein
VETSTLVRHPRTTYEDAIKTSGHSGEIELREISELVLASLAEPAAEHAGGVVGGRG